MLAPLLAACGVLVAKMSGRGLAHTGGTLDKLEAIPGMRVSLSLAGMRRQVEQVGVAVSGQTPELAPADGRLYAIRDATATVASMPLIAASIMSKKVAAGASRLLLDVKVGEGSLLPDADASRAAGRADGAAGRATTASRRGRCSRTWPSRWGRRSETRWRWPRRWTRCAGRGRPISPSWRCARRRRWSGDEAAVRRAIDSGAAYERFQRWVAAQGGDPEAPLPRAPLVVDVAAPRSGIVQRCHARPIGELVMRMGAGRTAKDGPVDHAVGILVHRKRGDRVAAGEPLATVHARSEPDLAAVAACFEIGDADAEPEPLLLGHVDA